MRRLLEGDVYFKVREMSNIKNLVIFSFEIKMKQIFNINEKMRNEQMKKI